jgi:hypothetical protein
MTAPMTAELVPFPTPKPTHVTVDVDLGHLVEGQRLLIDGEPYEVAEVLD